MFFTLSFYLSLYIYLSISIYLSLTIYLFLLSLHESYLTFSTLFYFIQPYQRNFSSIPSFHLLFLLLHFILSTPTTFLPTFTLLASTSLSPLPFLFLLLLLLLLLFLPSTALVTGGDSGWWSDPQITFSSKPPYLLAFHLCFIT